MFPAVMVLQEKYLLHLHMKNGTSLGQVHPVELQHLLVDVGNTWSLSGFSITVGQNGNNSATGKLTISETYNSGSLSTRAVIMRIYYGASSLGYDIA